MREGTALFLRTADLTDDDLAAPSLLPGWSRRHVVAHVAANAEALGNLVRWAATGEPTPMYASPAERAAGIERGAALPTAALIEWLRRTAEALDAAMGSLTEEQWRAPVVTNSGRTVPASQTPWMRAREVFVHAVDLDTGVGFADLPADFLTALCEDIVAMRGAKATGPALVLQRTGADTHWALPGEGAAPTTVTGALPELAAYLSGRPHRLGPVPELPVWL